MTSITIHNPHPDSLAPLLLQYPGQWAVQPAYVELDGTGDLSAWKNSEIGNAIPMSVVHGLALRWDVNPFISGEGLTRLLAEIAPLAERVMIGWTKGWDGRNVIGRLNGDAQAASDEIGRLCVVNEDDLADVWDTDEWLWTDLDRDDVSLDLGTAGILLTAVSTDAQIALAADVLREIARSNRQVIEWDNVTLDDLLRDWRDDAAAQRAST